MENTMNYVKVSVIIPVYNAEKYIRECLDSLKKQTLEDIEIICVDDGSVDGTLEILQQYAEGDRRIKLLQQKNQYAGVARNYGMEHASGKYMIFLDADDFFDENLLERTFQEAERCDADVVLFGGQSYDNITKEVKPMPWLLNTSVLPQKIPFSSKETKGMLLSAYSPAPWTKLFRSDFIRKHHLKFQALQNSNDVFFIFCATCLADKITYLDEKLVYYRRNSGSSLQSTKRKQPLCFLEAYSSAYRFLNDEGIYQDVKKGFRNTVISGCLYNYDSYTDKEEKKIILESFLSDKFKEMDLLGGEEGEYISLKNYRRLKDLIENYRMEKHRKDTDNMSVRNMLYKLPFIRGILRRLDKNEEKIRELEKNLNILNKENKNLKEEVRKAREANSATRELVWNHGKEQEEKNKDFWDRLNAAATIEQVESKYKGLDSKLNWKEAQLRKFINYRFFQGLNKEDYPRALSEWYYEYFGKELHLDHPVTYNEKMQWIKLFDNSELKTLLADKYAVREWVEEKIGKEYLIPLLGVWDRFDEIDFDKLPQKFVLKANHGCGYNYIVRNKEEMDYEDVKKKFTVWMAENFAYNSLELQYMDIPHKIIAEEYVENGDQELNDYKIFCFNGKAKYIMFLAERQTHLKMAFYDLDWNLLPFTYSYPQYTKEVPRPKKLDEMIQVAEKLAEGFIQVRVDLYYLNDDSIKFGEMTMTSASGRCRWNPPEYDEILGKLVELPVEKG